MSPGEQMALTIISSVLASGGLWAFIQARLARKSAVAVALQCLLRDRILALEKEYRQQGYCDHEDKTNIEHMFKSYQELGGNDVAHAAYNNVMALPSYPPESEIK